MKVQLPTQAINFERGLILSIERILAYQICNSFLSGVIDLVQDLRSNPITMKWIQELEEEAAARVKRFNMRAQDVLEKEWLFLWRLHRDLRCRKILARLKRLITGLEGFSTMMPIPMVCFSFSQLKTISPVMKRIQNIRIIYQKIRNEPVRESLKIKVDTQACGKICEFKEPKIIFSTPKLEPGRVIHFDEALCTSEFNQFFKENAYLFMNPKDKAQYIQTSAERDAVYLWDRLCLIEKIFCYSTKSPEKKLSHGSWERNRETVFENALEASCKMLFPLAQRDTITNFDREGLQKKDIYCSRVLPKEYLFTRKGCEACLNQLLFNIKVLLLNQEEVVEVNPKTQTNLVRYPSKSEIKEIEVVEHAEEFWKDNPYAKHAEVHADYKKRSLRKDPYKIDHWEEIVRLRGLDPRPLNKKPRGKAEKGR